MVDTNKISQEQRVRMQKGTYNTGVKGVLNDYQGVWPAYCCAIVTYPSIGQAGSPGRA